MMYFRNSYNMMYYRSKLLKKVTATIETIDSLNKFTTMHIKERFGIDVKCESWFVDHDDLAYRLLRVMFRFASREDLHLFKLVSEDNYYYSYLALGEEIVFDRYSA